MELLSLFPEEEIVATAEEAVATVQDDGHQPLAYRMAPQSLGEYVGQPHLVGPNQPLRCLIESDQWMSMVMWGPPGCGKTSLAKLMARVSQAEFVYLNAVSAKLTDIRQATQLATTRLAKKRRTIVFVDELHRFSKTQQDALLPEVEKGTFIFIGATTESPFFSVIPSLISRCRVFELKSLDEEALSQLAQRAQQTIQRTHPHFLLTDLQLAHLIKASAGDARRLLNDMDMVGKWLDKHHVLTEENWQALIAGPQLGYGDASHYDILSALIKSMRGSDPDASLYWLARMLRGGEDPLLIARRLVIFASEDVGNADPAALPLAVATMQAAQWIGMPEIPITLSQTVAYLATAPKSNASYVAIQQALACIDEGNVYEVPDHLKHKGQGYLYPHDQPDGALSQLYIPHAHHFYQPKHSGFENELVNRLRILAIQKGKL